MGTDVPIRGRGWAANKDDRLHASCAFNLLQGFFDRGWEKVNAAGFSC